MVVMYDDFFQSLRQSDLKPEQFSAVYPKSIEISDKVGPDHAYDGLGNLLGKKLVVGSDSPPTENIEGVFMGEDTATFGNTRIFDCQVFEVPPGRRAANGEVLPLVARIKSSEGGNGLKVEIRYGELAVKYFLRGH